MNGRILLVEDEAGLVVTLGDRLRNEGYRVEVARDGREGLDRALNDPFDLIILDVMLPKKNGVDVCRDLRQNGLVVPILMLTARSQTKDKVAGLKTGADDYVTKPFSMQELMARIEALLRRAPTKPSAHPGTYEFGGIRVDRRGTTVTRDGQPVGLSAREFQLLQYFIDHPDATLSREELLTQVWGYDARVFTRTVDVHVAGLRHKLEADPREPAFIQTVQRIGYKFVPRS